MEVECGKSQIKPEICCALLLNASLASRKRMRGHMLPHLHACAMWQTPRVTQA